MKNEVKPKDIDESEEKNTISTPNGSSKNDTENVDLINIVMRLYEKIELLEHKLSLIETKKEKTSCSLNDSNEIIPVQEYDVNKAIYNDDKKFNFLLRRVKFLTTEFAKTQYQLRNHDLYVGKSKPISGEVNKNLVLVVCADYPHEANMYGGAFIVARVKAYKEAGYSVKVCVPKGKAKKTTEISSQDDIEIYRGDESLLQQIIIGENPACIVVHSPKPENYNIFKKLDVLNRLIFIFHGFEVRDVGHLWYNFDIPFLNQKAHGLFQQDMNRKKLAIEVFQNPEIHKVFVSNFFKGLVTDDIGVDIHNSHVIPNLIESELFTYQKKDDEDRLKVFSIRPYDNNNYAADLIVQTVLELSEKHYFNELSFHIQGFGTTFKSKTLVIKHFSNVTLSEGVLTRPEISMLHKQYGVALIPTRFDTQGVSVGEAMSSGLVPVTNNCTAIPEFVDINCAVLSATDDIKGMVQGIEELYYNSDLYKEKSIKAASHIRRVAGKESTVDKELELIKCITSNT